MTLGKIGMIITPLSTGNDRYEEGEKYEQACCDEFNKTHSIAPGDYRDKTVRASYMIALIAKYLGSIADGSARPPKSP